MKLIFLEQLSVTDVPGIWVTFSLHTGSGTFVPEQGNKDSARVYLIQVRTVSVACGEFSARAHI